MDRNGTAAGASDDRPVSSEESPNDFLTTAPSITLPKGGGAVSGLGEKFDVNPVTGTGALSVPLPVSAGRPGGLTPDLSLGYDSGSGNSVFGLGWSLVLPAITRKTSNGLPRYEDHVDSDTFVLSGAEDLVPAFAVGDDGEFLRGEDSTYLIDEFERLGYRVRRYRPRIEGLFARIERWTNPDDGSDVHWRSISRDNVLSIYGLDQESRVFDPTDQRRIASWLLCETRDDRGNAVLYQYKPEDGSGVELSQAYERNRGPTSGQSRTANRYLKRLLYGNVAPLLNSQHRRSTFLDEAERDSVEWMFETVFDYGEHDPESPTPAETSEWDRRPDPFSSYRAGFEVRTSRRCQRVLLFHHFEGEAGVGRDCLVRSLDLKYEETAAEHRGFSKLESIQSTSYQRDGAGYRSRSLPPLEFTYSDVAIDASVREVDGESAANLPSGIDGSNYRWVDLYGEGIPGVLTEQGGQWYYRRNLSPRNHQAPGDPGQPTAEQQRVSFGVVETIDTKPNARLGAGAQLVDVDGDGRVDVLVSVSGRAEGFYPGVHEGSSPFQPLPFRPNRPLSGPNARSIDLTGDGRPDLLITEDEALTWYQSDGADGFRAAERVAMELDEERGPRLVFADTTESLHTADMSGDGLQDLVRIRNGEIAYWPNLGYCRFGPKVTMDDSPVLDHHGSFDPGQVRLADIDGSGPTDLIYLAPGKVRLHFNQSGNSWSAAQTVDAFPPVDDLTGVMTADLLGNGTTCLVWSSPLPGSAQRAMRYVNLVGDQKPHLLISTRNNLGAETTVDYAPSTKFYLQDKAAGTPWISSLPFPVHVVERVTTTDRWRGTRFSATYSYHHGHYDGVEREFRGFARVQQTDVEDYGTFLAGNAASPYVTEDLTLYQPPVQTVSWFDTGAHVGRQALVEHLRAEFFNPQAGGFSEKRLSSPDLDALGLSAYEWREAVRARKGQPLRQEVYELDADSLGLGVPRRVRLFSASESSHEVRVLQPAGSNEHAVFLAAPSESLSYHYELDLDSEPDPDPRVNHTLVLSTDDLGNPLETIAVGYPRFGRHVEAELAPEALDLIAQMQSERHVSYTSNRYTADVDELDDYRARKPCGSRVFELTGAAPSVGSFYSMAELRDLDLGSSVPELAYHRAPHRQSPQKRLVDDTRSLYFSESLEDPLPWGQMNHLGLVYESYQLATTVELLTEILGSERFNADIRSDLDQQSVGGYASAAELSTLFPDDIADRYWIRSGVAGFSADPYQHFLLPNRYQDPFDCTTSLELDERALYLRSSTDPVGNIVRIEDFDYRVLAPVTLRDINDNVTETAYDVLGSPTITAVRGKGDEGDHLDGLGDNALNPALDTIAEFFDDDYQEARARDLLATGSARHVYDLGERVLTDGSVSYGHRPPAAATIQREVHLANGDGAIQIAFAYFDGAGQALLSKAEAEPENPGGARRWLASGKTVLNNKGNPAKQYQPVFADSHRFEEVDEGICTVHAYDAVGREIRTDAPDGTFTRIEVTPWRIASFDANDTVLEPGNRWFDEYSAGSLDQERAARCASVHAGTPTVVHLDSLGREVVNVAHNREQRGPSPGGEIVESRFVDHVRLDAEGKPLYIVDRRGNRVVDYQIPPGAGDGDDPVPAYDIAGNLLFEHSMDAGDRWMLPDSTGQPLHAWDENDRFPAGGSPVLERRHLSTSYDELHRPLDMKLRIDDGAPLALERFEYGESHPEAADRNLRGQVHRHFDPGGLITNQRFGFKGELEAATRQLPEAHDVEEIDWATDSPSDEVFAKRTTNDALGRMVRLENWHIEGEDAPLYLPIYNRRGLLESETLTVAGQTTDAVVRVTYDANGQRLSLELGNGSITSYSYYPESLRLAELRTTGPVNGLLQLLSYTYDPVGNITDLRDGARQAIFFRNNRVAADAKYTYDALYQLISATGREHLGIANGVRQAPKPPSPDGRSNSNLPHRHDGQAMGTYTEHYYYDPAGNIARMQHVGTDPPSSGWTRHYTYAAGSNRLLETAYGSGGSDRTVYRYDRHGNMLNVVGRGGDPLLTWDRRDMIFRADLGGGGKAFYRYDSSKQRVAKRVERRSTTHEERVYLEGSEIYRRFEGGVEVERIDSHHLFLDDQRVLLLDNVDRTNNPQLEAGQLHRYQYADHLRSVTVELDADSNALSYEEYHPYGTTACRLNTRLMRSLAKRYRYTGMEKDEETGLAYHTARYYLPWLARWASTDPAGLNDGPNLYLYASANPVGHLDVSGTDAEALEQSLRARLDRVQSAISAYNQMRSELKQAIDQYESALRPYLRAAERAARGRGIVAAEFSDPVNEAQETIARIGRGLPELKRELQGSINGLGDLSTELAEATDARMGRVEGQPDYRTAGRRTGHIDELAGISNVAEEQVNAARQAVAEIRPQVRTAARDAGNFHDLGDLGRELREFDPIENIPRRPPAPGGGPRGGGGTSGGDGGSPGSTPPGAPTRARSSLRRRLFRRFMMALPVIDVIYQQVNYEENAYFGHRVIDGFVNLTVAEVVEVPALGFTLMEAAFEESKAEAEEQIRQNDPTLIPRAPRY